MPQKISSSERPIAVESRTTCAHKQAIEPKADKAQPRMMRATQKNQVGGSIEAQTGTVHFRLQTLLHGPTTRPEEAEVLRILSSVDTQTLNHLIENTDLQTLLSSLDNHGFWGPKNYRSLLTLLSKTRVSELNMPSKTALIDALQTGKTGRADERAIRNIFLNTRGEKLSELKHAIDQGGSYRDLMQLIYRDIDTKRVRKGILTHIQREGTKLTSKLRVLSDIDDTLYVNFKDQRYPKKTVYPGVTQFYRELMRKPPGSSSSWGPVFLTARPEERTGALENLAHHSLEKRGVRNAVVLSGSLFNLIGNASIAKKKNSNFERYQALYPELHFVFIGDNGQGDAQVASHFADMKPQRVWASFIHNLGIQPLNAEQRLKSAEDGVYLFDTYVGAAVHAHRLNLIDDAGLRRIIVAAQTELSTISFESIQQAEARNAELVRDIQNAMTLLAQA